MSLIEKEISMFFSNDEAKDANQKQGEPSRFTVFLDKSPITVPESAVDVSIECLSANVWFTSPNISSAYKNDKLWLKYEHAGKSVEFSLDIPKGLYSITTLNATIQRMLYHLVVPGGVDSNGIVVTTEGGVNYFTSNCVCLKANVATQKTIIQLGKGLSLLTDTAKANNIAPTLGFTHDPVKVIAGTRNTGYAYEADSTAKMNKVNQYLLHGSIVQKGIAYNNRYNSILAEIQVDRPPGSLITYRPIIPYRVDGKHLTRSRADKVEFWLTNEDNEAIDLNGDFYSFSIVIRYKVPSNLQIARNRG